MREALQALARQLRSEGSVISPHVRDPASEPVLGLLVASGPRAAAAPGEYALLIEAVREGYLLHYREPRIVAGSDRDLALLAGDYLYARGLERLAALGDTEAVTELADLISLCAQVHARYEDGAALEAAETLWLASVVAVAAGASDEHEEAKAALRQERNGAVRELYEAALAAAERGQILQHLKRAAPSLDLRAR